MNWLAMARRLVVGADAARNQTLTLLLLLLLTPLGAQAFDGSLSVELSGGNKTFSGSLIGDWGIVPDKLYLVASYGLVKQQPSDPAVTSSATHLFGLGLDWIPSMHVMTSLNASFSPKATDSDVIRETPPRIDVSSTRRSAQLVLAGGYQSAGLSDLEWGVDIGALGAWYEIANHGRFGPLMGDRLTNLFLLKPSAGLTFTFFDKNELGVRGSYSIYSSDPSQAGAVPDELGQNITREAVADAFDAIIGRAEATSQFSAAPVQYDLRVSFLRRFGARVTGRFAYTFQRYVHALGNAHAFSTRWTFKLTSWLKLWGAVTVQYDWQSTPPSFWSGYGTVGTELATE